MESIMYNSEDKEVVIMLGYGIGNHLSLKFLKGIITDITKLFPDIKDTEGMQFHEVAQSSRSHRYCWYTRFPYDLSNVTPDKWGNLQVGNSQVYVVTGHKVGDADWVIRDETAAEVMNRLIHN